MNLRRALVILIGVAVLAAATLGWFMARDRHWPIPDEKKVAMELLGESQTGMGYFHAPVSTAPDTEGILWAEPDVVEGQIDRVVAERKFSEEQRRKLQKLVRDLVEEHPSRAIGGVRINLARLNVALDALD